MLIFLMEYSNQVSRARNVRIDERLAKVPPLLVFRHVLSTQQASTTFDVLFRHSDDTVNEQLGLVSHSGRRYGTARPDVFVCYLLTISQVLKS